MWFDSHCHLGADEFSEDRAAVAERAFAGGVEGLVAIGSGYGVRHNERAVALAQADPRVWATVGVHPHEAKELDGAGRADLLRWLDAPRVVAVGEAGLDYHYMMSPREVQRAVFAEQVGWARERGLPVTIHVRGDDPNAFDELLDIWTAERGPEVGGVLHCYTGSLEFARRALDAELDVSFSGSSRSSATAGCARSPRRCRSIACWSRPMRRCSRPRDIAAGATSPRASST